MLFYSATLQTDDSCILSHSNANPKFPVDELECVGCCQTSLSIFLLFSPHSGSPHSRPCPCPKKLCTDSLSLSLFLVPAGLHHWGSTFAGVLVLQRVTVPLGFCFACGQIYGREWGDESRPEASRSIHKLRSYFLKWVKPTAWWQASIYKVLTELLLLQDSAMQSNLIKCKFMLFTYRH